MDEQTVEALDFDARYEHTDRPGIAWRLVDRAAEHHRGEDIPIPAVDSGEWVWAVMVGDDSRELLEVQRLRRLADDESCGSCGQVGCSHDGRDRDGTLSTRTFDTPMAADAACYSDHSHDISTRGACDFCGSDDALTVKPVLPHVMRSDCSDPVVAARTVLEARSAMMVDGVLLDYQTANVIVAVYDALSTREARARLRTMPIAKAGVACWKLATRG